MCYSQDCDVVLTILFYKLVEFGDQSRRVWSPKSTTLVFKIVRTRIQGCQNYITELPEQDHQTKNTIKLIKENRYIYSREVKHLSE